jgi:TolB-like protein/Flp pilus assembly protein TadD
MSLFNELKRRNVIRVGFAYLALAWLLTEIASTLFPIFGIPEWGVRFIVLIFILGFLPTLIFSWVYELTPEGLKREKDVVRDASITQVTAKRLDMITIVLIVAAVALLLADRFLLSSRFAQQAAIPTEAVTDTVQTSGSESQYPPNSIAVLPFVNMSDDPGNEYFSDGISEELLNLLAKISELQVTARTSSFSFKEKDVKIADIAQELNVAHVLEGSVRKSGDQVRITAQLIRSTDSFHLWSATYDRTLDNIFTIQDEIAAAVVGELKVTLLGEPAPQSTTTDPEAYALYLQGRHVIDRLTKEGYEEAELLLKKALLIDPGFAPAWRELGVVYLGQEDRGRPADEARKLAKDALEHALMLDPEFAPVYSSLSLLARMNFDYVAADQYLQEALQLKDDSAFPYGAAASLSRTFGRLDKSIDLARKSVAYDPVSSAAYANLGYSCYYAFRLDEAASSFRKSISLNPKRFRAYVYLGRVLLAQGQLQEAVEVIQKAPDHPIREAGLAMAYHALGDGDTSHKILVELIENWGESMAFQIAEFYAFSGEIDAAFEWLQKALDTRDPGLNVLLGNPVFDKLTSDDRYQSLVEQMGLLQYWQEMNLEQSDV